MAMHIYRHKAIYSKKKIQLQNPNSYWVLENWAQRLQAQPFPTVQLHFILFFSSHIKMQRFTIKYWWSAAFQHITRQKKASRDGTLVRQTRVSRATIRPSDTRALLLPRLSPRHDWPYRQSRPLTYSTHII